MIYRKTKITDMRSSTKLNNYFLQVVNILLIVACLFIVLLSSSIGRPIWLDEFLHFAICSYRSTYEALDVISKTLVTINHGQTGVYFIIDYWLLSFFGASSFWLRFPSIIFGAVLMLASVYTFKLWKLPIIWQFVGILALFSQSFLMYFIGEARPYMPLAAASICSLAYYSTAVPDREKLRFKLFGFFSILTGVIFHPYFSIYWLSICCFSYLFTNLDEWKTRVSLKSFVKHCDIQLVVLGSTVYFVVGKISWMRGRPEFSMDPFELIKGDGFQKTFFEISHTQFLNEFTYPFLGIIALALMIVIFIPKFRRSSLNLILPPITLMLIGFSLSAFLATVSFYQNYWIMPRQWVASIALVTLASVWFAYNLSKCLSRFHVSIAVLWFIVFLIPIATHSYEALNANLPKLMVGLHTLDVPYPNPLIPNPLIYNAELKAPVLENGMTGLAKFFDEWVALADENIRQGGPVWSIFQDFYRF